MKKKILAIIICITIVTGITTVFTGCGKETNNINSDSPIVKGESSSDKVYYKDLLESAKLLYPSSNDEWEYIVYEDNLGNYDKFIEISRCLIDQSNRNTIELLEIPSEIEGYPVIALGDSAMADFDIYELVIPNTVIHIGKSFCSGCDSLNMLTLPSSLITVEDNAFYGHYLEELELPENIEYIGERAFAAGRTYKISEVTLPESLAYIGYSGIDANVVTVLNPNMVFGGASDGGIDAEIFYGYAGSTTATFCAQEHRTFKVIS